ncbi:hypothetical protein [Aurantimonas sp. HBX-1]|uniref:hypothetical protein n=1 Tax=Aurantimonas sp. HBX-1 TaxID=2906072 RepID=UPI001F338931|nr:hypothetical protein [Aurantimonas sp. HBX-1]UIJ73532.1 hypothetical protein LXB15_07850 [Aurantimonas sp. HBX-1]
MKQPFRKTIAALLLSVALGGCASAPEPAVPGVKADSGLDRLERLTLNANRCWFKSKDPAFAAYSLAPELSSFTGRPRFLLVPRGQIEARPLLVVEGRTGSGAIDTYGPLMNEPVSARISADLARWRGGANGCEA